MNLPSFGDTPSADRIRLSRDFSEKDCRRRLPLSCWSVRKACITFVMIRQSTAIAASTVNWPTLSQSITSRVRFPKHTAVNRGLRWHKCGTSDKPVCRIINYSKQIELGTIRLRIQSSEVRILSGTPWQFPHVSHAKIDSGSRRGPVPFKEKHDRGRRDSFLHGECLRLSGTRTVAASAADSILALENRTGKYRPSAQSSKRSR
jgi:hypothetical protein